MPHQDRETTWEKREGNEQLRSGTRKRERNVKLCLMTFFGNLNSSNERKNCENSFCRYPSQNYVSIHLWLEETSTNHYSDRCIILMDIVRIHIQLVYDSQPNNQMYGWGSANSIWTDCYLKCGKKPSKGTLKFNVDAFFVVVWTHAGRKFREVGGNTSEN